MVDLATLEPGAESREWRRNTAQVAADLLPGGRRPTMDGQPHDVEPVVLGPIVTEFVAGCRKG